MAIVEAELLEVVIEDNGQSGDRRGEAADATGRRAAALRGGTGLAGLQRRARRIGASFDFERTPRGARTLLRLPLRVPGDARPGNESVRDSSQLGAAAFPPG
jgi:signal transduction histidine kinase